MQELEKILEEIEKEAICISSYYVSEKFRDKEDLYVPLSDVNNIIRKHMNDDQCAECSRRKWHPKGFEDGKKNDGWISVEDRLPEEKQFVLATWGKPNYRKNVTEIYISILKLIHDKEWYGDCGIPNGKVTAWRPLPEPYSPERNGE